LVALSNDASFFIVDDIDRPQVRPLPKISGMNSSAGAAFLTKNSAD
jgi:hypothetical protein